LHPIDQLTVKVADIGREPPLTEIIVVGRGWFVTCQVEDSDVDGGNDDPRILARSEAANFHRNAQRTVRTQQPRQLHIDCERARFAVDGEPAHSDRTARHALGTRIERTAQRRDHIGSAAPIVADGHAQFRGARRYVLGNRRAEAIADDIERDFAGGPCSNRHGHAFTGDIFRLVECDLQHVRSVRTRLRVPTRIKGNRGDSAVAVCARNLEAITAPLHRDGDARGLARGHIGAPIGNALRRLDRFELPAALAAIPLVPGLHLEKLIAQRACERCTFGRNNSHVE